MSAFRVTFKTSFAYPLNGAKDIKNYLSEEQFKTFCEKNSTIESSCPCGDYFQMSVNNSVAVTLDCFQKTCRLLSITVPDKFLRAIKPQITRSDIFNRFYVSIDQKAVLEAWIAAGCPTWENKAE